MESTENIAFKEVEGRASKPVRFLSHLLNYLMFDFLGGPRILRADTVMLIQGVAQIIFIIFCYFKFQIFNFSSFVAGSALIAHEIMWSIKYFYFPDRSWKNKMTFGGTVFYLCYQLSLWLIPYYPLSSINTHKVPVSDFFWASVCFLIFATGLTLQVSADAYKNSMKAGQGLITNGIFSFIRHPNYLGQGLMYCSVFLLSLDLIPLIPLCLFIFVAGVNISMKEASMSRYPNWKDYTSRTKMIIPWIF